MACSDIGTSPYAYLGTIEISKRVPDVIQRFVNDYLRKIHKDGGKWLSAIEDELNECFGKDFPHLPLEFGFDELPPESSYKRKFSLIVTKRPGLSKLVCGKCSTVISTHLKKMCQQCNVVAYCNRHCRKTDRDHKAICRELVKIKDAGISKKKYREIQRAQQERTEEEGLKLIREDYGATVNCIVNIRKQKKQLLELIKKINSDIDNELLKESEAFKEVLSKMDECLNKRLNISKEVQSKPLNETRGNIILRSQLHSAVIEGLDLEQQEKASWVNLKQLIEESGNEDLKELFQEMEKYYPENSRFSLYTASDT